MATTERVLFLCTHSSARSQMAEGWLRQVAGDRFEVASAGTEATRVRPLALRAMAAVGIDLSSHSSKTLERFLDQPWDYVITVCDDANEACPLFPGGKQRLHWSFPDPSKATGTEDEQLAVYRAVRDAIRARIDAFVACEPRQGIDAWGPQARFRGSPARRLTEEHPRAAGRPAGGLTAGDLSHR
jgi:arsenate reductase